MFLPDIVGGDKKKKKVWGYVQLSHTFNNRKHAKLWYNIIIHCIILFN